ncbi:DUF2975 domain-containing protein [Aurantibacter crassamenti]|uniref:DUF2975 domain-containing protein n=1 Tax=Aurantibacter crassamenti TaxID=1837375 RepID=UPI00193A8998|nr:DUF2975 domain-containing protein [Aurantibacter crassamenti]MBM1106410.1 DUF2975 domain-containing protein [Aurantibacter crassamenti]
MNSSQKIKDLKLITFLLGIFRIGFFLLAFSLSIWAIIGILVLVTNTFTNNMSFPVMFSLVNEGAFHVSSELENGMFVIKDAMGIMSSDTLPKSFIALHGLFTLSINICILFSIRQIVHILESAKTGNFLVVKNAIRLRWIAILGLIILFFDRLSTLSSATYFSSKLEYSGLEFNAFNVFSLMEFDTLFIYLFLLVIAEAFRLGAQLKEENDLTI